MNQNKIFEIKLNLVWYCQASNDVEAEKNAIDAFCLEDAPSCSTWDLQVSEMVNIDALKSTKNDVVKLAVVEEMLAGTSSIKILQAMKDLILGIESDKEIVKLISKTLLKQIDQKIKEVEESGK